MTTQGDVIIVEGMRSGAVDPGGFRRGYAWAGKVEAGLAGGWRQHLVQEARRLLDAARDQRADAVGKAGLNDAERRRRNALEPDAGNETTERLGQRLRHVASMALDSPQPLSPNS